MMHAITLGFRFVAIAGIFFLVSEKGMAQATTPKTQTMDIQTDMLPPPSAEEVMPTHPFFAGPTSPEEELLEMVEELKDRVKKLEDNAAAANVAVKPGGGLVIESKGDIEMITPGVVKFKAKSVEMPKAQ